jgi:hypothetical protein
MIGMLWVCGKAEHHGAGSTWQKKLLTSQLPESRERQKAAAARDKIYPSKVHPTYPLPPFKLHLTYFHQLPTVH